MANVIAFAVARIVAVGLSHFRQALFHRIRCAPDAVIGKGRRVQYRKAGSEGRAVIIAVHKTAALRDIGSYRPEILIPLKMVDAGRNIFPLGCRPQKCVGIVIVGDFLSRLG